VPTEIERLYREHRAGLVRLVERELRDHHEAEDVVQTAFLDAQRALERGTIPRNPRAWLATIALNAARRLRRRRLNAAPLEEYAAQEASGTSEIRSALTSLPTEQRTAVLYRDVLGFSYGETAEQMGRSVNAVTMLLHRGRRRLRQSLGATTGGIGVWRWVRRAGMPQAAVAKGAAAVVVTAGLATTGVVAARAVAPIGTKATAEVAVRVGTPSGRAGAAGRTPKGGAIPLDSARQRAKTPSGLKAKATPAPTQGPVDDAAPVTGHSSTADVVTKTLSQSKLVVPTVSLPTVSIPTLPATVTVSTPVTTVTVAVPTITSVTVTTSITTVTVPIP
jgi:RNA polymerase sigma-70 factor, ECF subfamily